MVLVDVERIDGTRFDAERVFALSTHSNLKISGVLAKGIVENLDPCEREAVGAFVNQRASKHTAFTARAFMGIEKKISLCF
jgi:hypothetical protein